MTKQEVFKKQMDKKIIQNKRPKIYFIEALAIKQDMGMTRIYSAISQKGFFNANNNKN